MSRQFKLRVFLRYINDDLLHHYFQKQAYPIQIPQNSKNQTERAENIEKQIFNLGTQKTRKIEANLSLVNNLACEGGIATILELSGSEFSNIPSEIGEIENHYNQSLYCFLNYPELFENASMLYYMTELKGKKERIGLKKVSISEAKQGSKELAKAIKGYFLNKDGRGKYCEIDTFEHDDRICFIAYPENYAKSDLSYQEGKLVRMSRRSSFQITYIYYPEIGKLELSAQGGKKREKRLFNIFNETVLQDKKPVLENQEVYNLNKFLDQDLELPTDPDDQIEYVQLKRLRLISKVNNKHRITIEIEDGNTGVKDIHNMIQVYKIPLERFNIMYASIRMKFPGAGRPMSRKLCLYTP